MKLYYNPRSRAAIAKWMLDECDVNYEIVPVDFQKREHKTPEFLLLDSQQGAGDDNLDVNKYRR